MTARGIYYATNRGHEGKDRWRPSGYGADFSADGMENLRFGWLTVDTDLQQVDRHLRADSGYGLGDGNALAAHFTRLARHAAIEAYQESVDPGKPESVQRRLKLGSKAMFADLQREMQQASDVLIYVHGFNVSWPEAVGSALALQEMLNRDNVGDPAQKCRVVLFSWPSDGKAVPWVSYRSDRTEAQASGYAFARGILKVRDFLARLITRSPTGALTCRQDLHLLCHSMGNFVLQNALARIAEFSPGPVLPKLFEQVFLCAPDVDADVLESGKALGRLHELASTVTTYHNRGDVAMHVSDFTKSNPARLGRDGSARPQLLPKSVHEVDCSPVVGGVVEHSYYLDGWVADDIVLSIDGFGLDAPGRRRRRRAANGWVLEGL